jgi:ubiquinone biosynthesis protein UbiJ
LGPAFPLDLVNRALAREPALQARLAAHSGAAFAVASGPVRTVFFIEPDGQLAFPLAATPIALTLRVAPLDLPALLHDPATFDALVQVDGDTGLAATLKDLAQTLPWFAEQGLAAAFGPVAGQRLADAGRGALGFPAQAAARWRAGMTSYLFDETDTFVRKGDGVALATEAEALAARVDALATRVAHLEQKPRRS